MDYFTGLNAVTDIKAAYRKLASKNHPDKGGVTAIMQEINAQYHEALQNIDGTVTKGTDGKNHTYSYNHTIEEELIDKINELLALNLSEIVIALIGTWIWITGETKQHKELLKTAKCKWHGKRKCWFLSTQKKTRYNNKASLSDLASSYGYKTFNMEGSVAIQKQ